MAFTEALSYLGTEELAWVSHPHTGIHTVCAYLPTVADIHKFINQKRETANKSFRNPPPQGAYAYFEPEKEIPQEVRQAEIERRKAHVLKTLGYDPASRKPANVKVDEAAELEALKERLKKPIGPSTPQFRKWLAEQGLPVPTEYPPQQEKAA